MVVDAAVLVIDDQQRCAIPDVGVRLDRHVRLGDKFLAFLYVVVGMLVGSENLSASRSFMVVVAGLDEAVLG